MLTVRTRPKEHDADKGTVKVKPREVHAASLQPGNTGAASQSAPAAKPSTPTAAAVAHQVEYQAGGEKPCTGCKSEPTPCASCGDTTKEKPSMLGLPHNSAAALLGMFEHDAPAAAPFVGPPAPEAVSLASTPPPGVVQPPGAVNTTQPHQAPQAPKPGAVNEAPASSNILAVVAAVAVGAVITTLAWLLTRD